MKSNIIKSLEKIYSEIPDFKCQHCHKCCGPIIWFEPEEILIRDYLQRNNLKRIIWTTNEFKKNNMICPYLSNGRCKIYPVRPIVCRLQGNINELKCKSSNNVNLLSKTKLNSIRRKYYKLIEETDGLNYIYTTHLITK